MKFQPKMSPAKKPHPALKKPQRKKATFPMVEKQLHKACDQLDLIQHQIQQVQVRLTRCRLPGAKHSLQVRLQVLRGMYSVFYTYSKVKAEVLQDMWLQEQDGAMEE